jgi:hypothetical protein
MIFREFYQLPSIQEIYESMIAKGIDDRVSVEEFLRNFESPYLALQMLIYAMLVNKTVDIDKMKSENFKNFAQYGSGKNKMTGFMASTKFPMQYADLFKKIFPEAQNNAVLWAREHKDITTDLNNPAIRTLLTTLVQQYIN